MRHHTKEAIAVHIAIKMASLMVEHYVRVKTGVTLQRILDELTHTRYVDAVFGINTVNYAYRPTIDIVERRNPEVYTALVTLGFINDKTDTSNESAPNSPKNVPI